MFRNHTNNSLVRPKLILFDLDDTLCDHDTSLRLRLRMAFAAAIGDELATDLDDLVDASVQRSISGTDHFHEILALFGTTDPQAIERAVASYVADRYYGLEMFEEALEVIDVIKRQATVGIVTNGPSRIQRDKVLKLQIGDLFSFILVSEEEGSWKPDPVIFRRALELGKAQPEEAVFVGDSPDHDIAGAHAAGLTSVWVNRRGRAWPGGPAPNYEISDLRELISLLGFESGAD